MGAERKAAAAAPGQLQKCFNSAKGCGWPVRNLYLAATAKGPEKQVNEKGSYSGAPLKPYTYALPDYVAVQAGSVPKILLTILVWKCSVDFQAASQGWSWALLGWEMQILLRDLFLMVLVAGGWDYLCYFSLLKERLLPYKFNKKYPPMDQFKRDVFWTTSATILAALQEILLMKWWAGGGFKWTLFGTAPAGETQIPWNEDFLSSSYTSCFILWTVTMPYWRTFHFHVIHRGMHPWFKKESPYRPWDLGQFLYRHIHSHHHKSYNPTAFSGINMLPGESIPYISAALIPLLFRHGCHPWIHLYTKLDLIIGAQMGHSGFDEWGGGAYFHQMHHAHFECNYGDTIVPLDWLFGTFDDGFSYAMSNSSAPDSGKKKGK